MRTLNIAKMKLFPELVVYTIPIKISAELFFAKNYNLILKWNDGQLIFEKVTEAVQRGKDSYFTNNMSYFVAQLDIIYVKK